MEPITQGLLGAAMGEVAAGRQLGRRAMLWGGLVGMSPDLDVLVAPLHDGFGEWLYHRGTTHSLWFGFVAGPAFGWLLWRWRDRDRTTPLKSWIALSILALVTHPILDGFTPYGTQLFAPFWRERFAWNGVGIVDPFYSVPLAFGVAFAWFRRVPPLHVSLALTALYLVAGVIWNGIAEREVRTALEEADISVERLDVYPTLLQPWLRHFVAHADGRTFTGWHTPAADGCLSWQERETRRDTPRARAVLATWEGRLLDWFADGHVGIEERDTEDGGIVLVDDLRYAWVDPTGHGMWGIRALVDDAGKVVGKPQRFSRQRGNASALFDAIAGRPPSPTGRWKTLPACRR